MTPYYQDASVTLYHGDCREVLSDVAVSAPVIAITDPPYNVGINYGGKTDDKRADYEAWCREWFDGLRLAHVTALTPGIVNVALWCRIAAPDWIIAWHKPGAMGRSPFGFCNWEPVLVYGKTKNRGGVDVVTAGIIPDASLNGHPCPKPLAWAKGLLTTLAASDDVVIDPFAGSGTTLLAAKELGHHAIGIEIEERYCEIAAKRLRQGVLFGPDTTAEPAQTGLFTYCAIHRGVIPMADALPHSTGGYVCRDCEATE